MISFSISSGMVFEIKSIIDTLSGIVPSSFFTEYTAIAEAICDIAFSLLFNLNFDYTNPNKTEYKD